MTESKSGSSESLIERARIESVSFNTTDCGRTLFGELADEIDRLRLALYCRDDTDAQNAGCNIAASIKAPAKRKKKIAKAQPKASRKKAKKKIGRPRKVPA